MTAAPTPRAAALIAAAEQAGREAEARALQARPGAHLEAMSYHHSAMAASLQLALQTVCAELAVAEAKLQVCESRHRDPDCRPRHHLADATLAGAAVTIEYEVDDGRPTARRVWTGGAWLPVDAEVLTDAAIDRLDAAAAQDWGYGLSSDPEPHEEPAPLEYRYTRGGVTVLCTGLEP